MKNDNSKNIIIALLVVIVIILVTLVVLFASGTITFNGNINSNNNLESNNGETTKNEDNLDSVKEESSTRYYQSYEETNESNITLWSSREITLNDDGTAEFRFNGTSVGGYDYKGTYTENDSQITLKLELITENNTTCDSNTSVNECIKNIIITKNSNSTLTEIYDLGNGSTVTYNYNSVEQNELKLPLN